MINRQINRKDNKLAPWDRGITTEQLAELKKLPSMHAEILEAGNLLGFDLNDKGICKGLSAAGASAFWVNILTEEDGLQAYFNRFQDITYRRPHQPQNYINLFGFFERVKLVQECPNYKPYHSQLIPNDQAALSAERLSAIEALIRPVAMVTSNNKPITILNVDTLIGGYTVNELNDFFDCLSNQLGDYPFELDLSNGEHAITLCFCPTKKDWLLFDANHKPLSVFNKTSHKQLAKILKRLLSDNSTHTVFSTIIRTADIFAEEFQKEYALLNKNKIWKTLHEVNHHQTTIQNQYGETLLYLAACDGHHSSVQALIAANADVNKATLHGATPLFIAAQNGHLSCVQTLIAANAKVNQATSSGITPLYIAAQNGHLSSVQTLIAANAKVNQATSNGVTPLFIAAHNGHPSCVKALIAANAKVNQTRPDGSTPLFIAAQNGYLSCVEILLAAGADVSLKYYGRTAAQIARYNGHHTVADYIEHYTVSFMQKLKSALRVCNVK